MYHCGPTVYQRPHIGNYRAFLFADLLRRWLEANGHRTLQVMNLTDVGHLLNDADEGEDKLEAQARREKTDPRVIVEKVSAAFFTDLDGLAILPAHHYPRASDHIPEMVALIERLLESGHAYQVGENVYFKVRSFANYGHLSGNKISELEAGARLEVNPEKQHPADFALWKADPQHIMKWETCFGPDGFPGWHIECSAMAMKYLGESFDIHTGGEDNVFPHHECEIAQSESATNSSFVNLWMHTRFLRVDGGKMSKSLGNVWNLDDLRERGFDPLDFRFFVLKAHYRGSLNFTWDALQSAREARLNLLDFRGRLAAAAGDATPDLESIARFRHTWLAAMAEDLNTSGALAAVFDLRSAFLQGELDPAAAAAALFFLVEDVDSVLGLFAPTVSSSTLQDSEIDALVERREEARRERNFSAADTIRDQLQAAGIVIEDSAGGARWHRSG